MAPRKNWPAIKAAYVEGVKRGDETVWLTLDEISERFGVNATNTRIRSAKEGWTTERAAFQRRVESERQSIRSNEIARIGADLDVTALKMAQSGMAIVQSRLAELGRIAELRTRQLIANPGAEPGVDPIESLELDRLSRAGAEWYGLAVRAIGEAPKFVIEVEDGEDRTPVEARDERALGVMGILAEHVPDLMPPEMLGVIDVGSRIRVVTGDGESGDRGEAHTEDQQLPPANADAG